VIKGPVIPGTELDRLVANFDNLSLGDPRREARVRKVVMTLAKAPAEPLPAAMETSADLEALYRLVNNQHISFADLIDSPRVATATRAAAAGRVLVLHDTTDLSFPHLDPKEVGFLATGKAGFKLHLGLVLDAALWRRPLGVVHAETLHRSERSKRGGRKKRLSSATTATWTDREYLRWWRGVSASSAALCDCEHVIHIADRESDSYELMARTMSTGHGFIFRVRINRPGRRGGSNAETWSTVRDVAADTRGVIARTVMLSPRPAKSAPGMEAAGGWRPERLATLTFAAARVELRRSRNAPTDLPAVLELNLVHIVETDPPTGEEPVEWYLYTTEPIDTVAQIESVVDNYRARWTIEEFNAALKTGTAYEARQFESRHALLSMLALSLPIAVELLWLRSRARSAPEAPATEVLTGTQIEILRELGRRKLSPAPTANEALYAVASLGGHLKNNGQPGWKVLRRGMTLLHSYERAWTAARRTAIGPGEM
jgi:hypothetical protein